MVDSSNVSELVSQAWQHHREGNNHDAIAKFETIAQQYPTDVDANYGLGLSQKAAGRVEAAVKAFKSTLELIDENKKSYNSTREAAPEGENIRTPEDDRFQMLTRMVQQRLTELESTVN